WGGSQEEVPIKWQKNTLGTSFSGAAVLPTTIVDNTVKMTFDAKFFAQPSNLTMTDVALTETEMRRASLLERQTESDAVDMMIAIATQLYGDGTGNSSQDFTGLGAAIDDGTGVASYGGLSRATYTSLNATVTSSGGTLTLAKMYTLWDTVQQDQQMPSVILTTKDVRSFFEQLLIANIRYSNPSELAVGANQKGLSFRDAMVVGDSACPAGKMFFINEDTFKFKALQSISKWPGAKAINYSLSEMEGEPTSVKPSGLGFFATPWLQPVNQLTMNRYVILGGNLICNNPRYNGVLTGVTGI
ncbi:MAG: phage major capsid protein, partial [Nitrososphaera sp.]|nr:phage major capsid protein [Nitrososphaera sp.]